jgi:uncharacterized protein YbjT (DUF2867 family)
MSKILVTGATGNIGSQLVPRLAAANGVEVRAFVRNEEKAAPLKAAGAELAVGEFEDAAAVAAAVKGIDTVVLITTMHPNAFEQTKAVLSAAKAAGVRKVVRISALKADPDGPTANTRLHGQTDNAIQASGLTYVILRPHFFMQNLFTAAQSIAADGAMYFGMGDGKMGMIDVRDIVGCTETVTLSDTFDNQILDLTGPERISFHDTAASLSKVLGQPVKYVPISLDVVEQSIKDMGWGDWAAGVFRDYSTAYSEGWGDFTTGDVKRITGHPARTFDVFAREVFGPALNHGS